MNAVACRGQEGAADSLELALEAAMHSLTLLLRSESYAIVWVVSGEC